MSLPLRDTELARLRAAQEWIMPDTCQVLAYSAADDLYNVPAASYTPGSAIRCGFQQTSSKEVMEAGRA